MEQSPESSDQPPCFQRVLNAVSTMLRIVRTEFDLNPHPGRLRGSLAPSRFIEIPDYPPVQDNLPR